MSTKSPNRKRPASTVSACSVNTERSSSISLDQPQAEALADRLKALADPTRLRLLALLAGQAQPLCVCEITPLFALHQPTISHHLKLLREAGLVGTEKRGVWSYFWATEEGRRYLSQIHILL